MFSLLGFANLGATTTRMIVAAKTATINGQIAIQKIEKIAPTRTLVPSTTLKAVLKGSGTLLTVPHSLQRIAPSVEYATASIIGMPAREQ